MIKPRTNSKWRKFHSLLMGSDVFINNRLIPKYILYYKGYDATKIIFGRYDEVKIVKK